MIIGGRGYTPGDRVITRRNDRRYDVDNGTLGTVIAINPDTGSVLLETDTGEPRALDHAYVARYLHQPYALTAHGAKAPKAPKAPPSNGPSDAPFRGPLLRGRAPSDVAPVCVLRNARTGDVPGRAGVCRSRGTGSPAGHPWHRPRPSTPDGLAPSRTPNCSWNTPRTSCCEPQPPKEIDDESQRRATGGSRLLEALAIVTKMYALEVPMIADLAGSGRLDQMTDPDVARCWSWTKAWMDAAKRIGSSDPMS